jgi:hypothetical protein
MVCLQNCGAVLLADSGYGLEPWLMNYDDTFIIERSFGQVKRRLPIIKHTYLFINTAV